MLPPDTLPRLHAAIVASPTDRAVRLVYADALEENGDPADMPRAEFIRAQLALDGTPDTDPRRESIRTRCGRLFASGWVRWWDAYCAAAGMVRPFVPRAGADGRQAGRPYERAESGLGIRLPDGIGAVEFHGGFPELLRLEAMPADVRPYFSALPLSRLAVAFDLTRSGRRDLDGPHLEKLDGLLLERVDDDVLRGLSLSTFLGGLRSLTIHARQPSHVRGAMADATWFGLGELHVYPHDGETLAAVGADCRLPRLRSLSVTVTEWLDDYQDATTAGPPWYGHLAGLRVVTASALAKRLTRFRLNVACAFDQLGDGSTNWTPTFTRPLGDDGVRALADGFDDGTLESLEVPTWTLTAPQRKLLIERWGGRLRLT